MTDADQHGQSAPTVPGSAVTSSPPAGMVGQSSKGLAVASLVCAICWPLFPPSVILLGPVALSLGIAARNKMRATNNFDGRGMARAGIIIGAIDTITVWSLMLLGAAVILFSQWRSNPADAACRGAVETATRIAPLIHGQVAALAAARTPFRVPDLTFKDADGRARTLADFRGRTVLLNLWATWCVPCRREMPALDALQRQLGGPKFQVVAVNIDTGDPQKPLAFLKQIGVNRLAYYSDESADVFEELKTAGKAFGMPTTLLVDPRGCEIGDMAGPAEWSSDDGVKLVRAIIADDAKPVTR
jgi:thiol-disulfide isomerase/thioredoxin